MRILKIIWTIIFFIFLTFLTQVGGVIYLISLLPYKFIHKRFTGKLIQGTLKLFSFFSLYFISTFFIVPILAKQFGRVPLPLTQTENLKPLNFLTCLLNRHYVHQDLRHSATAVSKEMNRKFPGTVVNYLDANFPFFKKFPLLPHLSHNDGKKLDIAFCYIVNKTGEQTNETPSGIGYGISEEPKQNEINTADYCEEKGYWQYSFLKKFILQKKNKILYLTV